MNHISLFSGIGGMDLASEWAGFKTILQVEKDPFCLEVLKKHFPDVERVEDIRGLDARRFKGSVDVLSGGFPCQNFSLSGKRSGKDGGDRDLWKDMFRIIQESSPNWIIGENVVGFLSLGIETTLLDLEREDYLWEVFDIPAVAIGALHRRSRVFIVGKKRKAINRRKRKKEFMGDTYSPSGERGKPSGRVQQEYSVFNSTGTSTTERRYASKSSPKDTENRSKINTPDWNSLSYVRRVSHGIPQRVDRLKSLGNAVVPQQVYPIFEAIAQLIKTEE